MKHFPLVSIVISNYNGVKLNTIKECLSSFKKIDYPNYELILVDNSSTDNSVIIAKQILGKNLRFQIIQNKINIYSQGLNLGLKAARGEYVAFFNNDLEVENKYFHYLIQSFERYPNLVLVQGKLLSYFDHNIIDSAGETMDVYGNPVTIGYRVKDYGQFDQEEEILSASGSACILKKSAIIKVGNYDSTYGIGYEDMDLALRIRQSGYIVMRVPSAICYHKRGTTDLSPQVRLKVKWHFNKNRLSTMLKNYPDTLLVRTIPITLSIYFCNMLWEVFIKRNVLLALMRPWAVIWVIMNLPQLLRKRKEIRRVTSDKVDAKIINLFVSSSILSKIQNVVVDQFDSKNNRKKR